MRTESRGGLGDQGSRGRGFVLDPEKDPILVAGGIGRGPPVFSGSAAYENAERQNLRPTPGDDRSRMQKGTAGSRGFQRNGSPGAVGHGRRVLWPAGLVTDLVKGVSAKGLDGALIYTCGPKGMLRAVASWAGARNVSCQVSLEAWMACGLGACLGCAVARPTAGGLSYAKVCQDGPVFEAQEVAWDA